MLNAWVDQLQYRKSSTSEEFFMFQSKTGEKSYGIQFVDQDHASLFIQCFTICQNAMQGNYYYISSIVVVVMVT